jgi:hypothetical protein
MKNRTAEDLVYCSEIELYQGDNKFQKCMLYHGDKKFQKLTSIKPKILDCFLQLVIADKKITAMLEEES